MKQTNCLFCNGQLIGKKSVEHIFPQWLLDHLSIRSEVIQPTHLDPKGKVISTRRHTMEALVAGRVCETCNNGWMSRLEVSVTKILKPLMAGEREIIDLNSEERLLLARWTAKTTYVLNYASNYRSIVPLVHFQALFASENELPKRVFVFAQQHHGEEKFYWFQGVVWDIRSQNQSLSQADLDNVYSKSYKTSFQLGKLLLLIAYWPYEGWRPILWRGIHVPLWPQRGPVGWYDKEGFPWHDSHKAIAIFHASLMIGKFDEQSQRSPRAKTKMGRNDPCVCGSGQKYKKCCGR